MTRATLLAGALLDGARNRVLDAAVLGGEAHASSSRRFALGTVRYALGVALFVLLLAAVEGRQALRFGGRIVPTTLVGLIGVTGFNLFVWIGLAYTRPEYASIILVANNLYLRGASTSR